MRLVVLLVCLSLFGKAQIDSAIAIPLVGIHFGGQLPFGDMANRFGGNLQAGGTFMFKTKKNWIYGLEFNYGFGRNVREDVLKQLKNSDGFVTDNEGFPADIRITERIVNLQFTVGRVFKLANLNPNSGLMVSAGAGYLQHKIRLYDAQGKIAAIKGDLAHGYDRLTSGLCLSQFIGYLFISGNKFLNFYTGFEFYEAFTTSVRKVNYDTGLRDTQKRFDMLGGFRIGWILPLYSKKPNEYYYD